MEKQWVLNEHDVPSLFLEVLKRDFDIGEKLGRVFFNRGLNEREEVRRFLNPAISDLHFFGLFKDMDKATRRFGEAILKKEKILFFGDYDVDGTSSIACFMILMRTFFSDSDFSFFVPNRLKDGYGITANGLRHIVETKPNLLITLDCGIKSSEAIEVLNGCGIDTIICDHHLVDGNHVPKALAILNPKQQGCEYPFKELCACGIAFKFIQSIVVYFKLDQKFLNEIFDLVVLATAADIVPLVGENRVLMILGLKKINRHSIVPMRALKKVARIEGGFNHHQLVFGLAPRINAAGRINHPEKAVRLLISDNLNEAERLAWELDKFNLERKDIDSSITEEAILLVENNVKDFEFGVVLYQEGWHKGVLGIIASRIVEKFYKPCIVLTKTEDGVLVGSARSVSGLNIVDAIGECGVNLLGFGGHYFAAGLQLEEKNYDAFKNSFVEVCKRNFGGNIPCPKIKIDCVLELDEVNEGLAKLVQQFEPYGPLNPRPIFKFVKVKIEQLRLIKDKHLKCMINNGKGGFKCIIFNFSMLSYIPQDNEVVDVLFHIMLNEWQGENYVELQICDIKKVK